MNYHDNVGDSDRWQDPRDIQDGETDQPAPTPRTDEFLSTIPSTTKWYVFARQLERELSDARAKAERMREALSFYAEDRRYLGPNQRREEGDKWTPEDYPYMVDVSRDRGEIAKAALAATRKEEGKC